MNELIKKLKSKKFEFDKRFLEKKLHLHIETGSLGEKAFFQYCERNKIGCIRALMLLIYVTKQLIYANWEQYFNDYEREKGEDLKPYEHKYKKNITQFIKKWDVEKFVSSITKKQLEFLYKTFVKLPLSNAHYGGIDKKSIKGFPDYFIYDGKNCAFVEIKTGFSELSEEQGEVISKLRKHFDVYLCHIYPEIVIKDFEIRHTDMVFDQITHKEAKAHLYKLWTKSSIFKTKKYRDKRHTATEMKYLYDLNALPKKQQKEMKKKNEIFKKVEKLNKEMKEKLKTSKLKDTDKILKEYKLKFKKKGLKDYF